MEMEKPSPERGTLAAFLDFIEAIDSEDPVKDEFMESTVSERITEKEDPWTSEA